MSPKANTLDNWADALPQGAGTSWTPVDDCAAGRPLPPDEVAERLKVPGGLAMIGLVLVGLAVLFFVPSIAYIVAGQTTEGVVVRIASRPSPRGETYAPVVAYVVQGEEYVISSSISTSWNRYHVGDTVPVLYFPNDPEDAIIGGFQEVHLFSCLVGVPGLALTIAGIRLGMRVIRKAGWRLLPA